MKNILDGLNSQEEAAKSQRTSREINYQSEKQTGKQVMKSGQFQTHIE